jgi:hypothetical protein
MSDEDRKALEDERTNLIRKAARRRDEPGFAANVREIDARIAEIDEALAGA